MSKKMYGTIPVGTRVRVLTEAEGNPYDGFNISYLRPGCQGTLEEVHIDLMQASTSEWGARDRTHSKIRWDDTKIPFSHYYYPLGCVAPIEAIVTKNSGPVKKPYICPATIEELAEIDKRMSAKYRHDSRE